MQHGQNAALARVASQLLIHNFERRKIRHQLSGTKPTMHTSKPLVGNSFTNVLLPSSCLSGVVFLTYFSIYNTMSLSHHPFIRSMANPFSTLCTSFLKIPLGNTMRLLQSGNASSICGAVKQLYTRGKMKGLYKGYRLALVEDTIEMGIRNKIIETFKSDDPSVNIGLGMVACTLASGITMPFDTLRLHICLHNATNVCAKKMLCELIKPNPFILYRGVHMRATSTAVKSMSYFAIYELLEKHTEKHTASGKCSSICRG
jgi:hypothetical protein